MRRAALLVLAYAALTCVATYPLPLHLATHHLGQGAGDARVYLWNMWWVKKAIVGLHASPLETDFLFHPIGIGLSLHTLGLLQGLAFIPSSALLGSVAGANLVVLATFVASALGAYLLARRLGANRWGAFLAGVIFAFCPARLARMAGHYDLLGTEWLPLSAWACLRLLREKGGYVRWALLTGAAVAACGYECLTYLVFLALLGGLFVLMCALRGHLRHCVVRTAAAAVFAALLLSPLLRGAYRDLASWTYPPYPGSDRYVADLMAYVVPAPTQTLLGGLLGRAFHPNLTETTVFAGLLAVLLAAYGVSLPAVRRTHGFWIVACAAALVLSLGDSLSVGGIDTGVPLPFAVLRKLPLLAHLRAPSRFSIVVMLSVALLASAAWSRLVRRVRSPAARTLLTAVAAAAFIAETAALPAPLFEARIPDVYWQIGKEPGDTAVIEIPGIDQVPGLIMHHQMAHGKRILIGFVARVPTEKASYFYGLPLVRTLVDLRKGKLQCDEALVAREREPAQAAARLLDLSHIVIERAFARRGVLRFAEAVLPVERAYEDQDRIVLRVRRDGLPPSPWTLEAGAGESRMYFASGWARPEDEGGVLSRRPRSTRSALLFRRPAAGPMDLVLDLRGPCAALMTAGGASRRVEAAAGPSAVRLPLPDEAEGALTRLALVWQGNDRPAVARARLEQRRVATPYSNIREQGRDGGRLQPASTSDPRGVPPSLRDARDR